MKKNPFTSKADVIKILYNKLKIARIEKPFVFTVEEWENKETDILEDVRKNFLKTTVIIRSSALGEDSLESSNAGNFLSIQNVSTDKDVLRRQIKKVINSYEDKNFENNKNQILIQKQTKNVKTSGVIFTRTSDNGSPYYVINYEDGTETDSVTKGVVADTITIFRGIKEKNIPKKWKKLIHSVREIERVFANDLLDIEFAITKKEVVIFQVRPITTVNKKSILYSEKKIGRIIENNKKEFRKSIKKNNFKNGLIFSDMTDWNPAEIIGDEPNPLDFSLYEYLIMKDAWTIGRSNLGYSKIDTSLMTKFSNKPYVNVGLSFRSLIPDSIDNKTKKKLVKFYLEKLRKNPFLHDKVEFEVIFSCYDFFLKKRLKEIKQHGFNEKEIKHIEKELVEFTNKIVNDYPKISEKAKNDIQKMEKKRKNILNETKNNDINSIIASLTKLLDDCREYGTIPFSSIARMAFVGSALLHGLKKEIKNSSIDHLLSSIETPLTEIRDDLQLLRIKKITKEKFLSKYGHLRPGTYDITAKRYYDEKEFFENIKFLKPKNKITYTLPQNKINNILNKSKIKFNDISFIDFISQTIMQREQIKFHFTKNLSDAIELIAKIGENLDLKREQMAMLKIDDIINCRGKKKEIKKKLMLKIQKSQKIKKINECTINPAIIFNEIDFEIIQHHNIKPNFISDKKISANIINLSPSNQMYDLEGKIILIENADPGFDWIFTKNPAGLITKYGGVASHMAIRCSELRLPAAIGCGELIFNNLKTSRKITLDCKNEKIMILEYDKDDEYLEEKKVLRSLGYIR
tara:strand:+ start:4551 stop:6956 length:2406 start_codon:yes stop_codon:yes gene_type:complete